MCVARLCTDVYALDIVQWRKTHNRDTDKDLRTDKQTWDPTLFQQSSCHRRMTAVMRHTINRQQGNLRLTHLQCSQYAWSRNQDVQPQSMLQIPSRLPREYESPSPDHRKRYTGVVNTVLRYSNVSHLHQRVRHKIGDTIVRTSRFTGNFTRDEWNNLLHLFNLSHFSSTCCAENSSLTSFTKTMAKRML